VFHDGNIYYDKIKKIALKDGRIYQKQSTYINEKDPQKKLVYSKIEFIFQSFQKQNGYYKSTVMSPEKKTFVV
jgi:hypothetical protein